MKELLALLGSGRLREPSTMAGGAALVGGINDMVKIADPSMMDAAILDAGVTAATTVLFNPTPVGIGMALFGLLSVVMGEKGGDAQGGK